MANRSYDLYGALDLRRYLAPGDFKTIFDNSNEKYNGKGWQLCAAFGPKQLSRVWANNVKDSLIVPKASTLAVGANKPIRSTAGWRFYGGNIFKIGHATKLDEDDLLKLQELAANDQGRLAELIIDAFITRSDELIIGMHNKLTSWVNKAKSTGLIVDSDIDGISVGVDMKVPADRKFSVAASWFDTSNNYAPNTTYNGTTVDPVANMLEAQKFADDNNIPYDHWEMTKAMYERFWQHPAVIAKCRNRLVNVTNTSYALVETDVIRLIHEYGVAPIQIVDEKSAREIDGILQVDSASFDPDALVLCQSGNLFEIKNACSVYEERVKYGGQTAADQYSFTGENNAIAILNTWEERPIQNIFETELWAFPVFNNPKNIVILNTQATHSWALPQVYTND